MKVALSRVEEAGGSICWCGYYCYYLVVVVAFLPCLTMSQGQALICR